MLSLAGEIFLPPAVERELAALECAWRQDLPRASVQVPLGVFANAALTWMQAGLLDPGEAEAIALARQLGADWFLTDDAAARLLAQQAGLEVHGALGVVLWAAAVGASPLDDCAAALDRLAGSTLWLSPRVLDEARAALARMRAHQ